MSDAFWAVAYLGLTAIVGHRTWLAAQGGSRCHGLLALAWAYPIGASWVALLVLTFNAMHCPLIRWTMLGALAGLAALLALSGRAVAGRSPALRPHQLNAEDRAPAGPAQSSHQWHGRLQWLLIGVLAYELVVGWIDVLAYPRIVDWDGWAIWGLKARAFFLDQNVKEYLGRATDYAFSWPTRPCLSSMVQAALYACLGQVSEGWGRLLSWCWYASLLAGFYALARQRASRLCALGGTTLLATVPGLSYQATAGLSNLVLGCYVFLAAALLSEERAGAGRGRGLLLGLAFSGLLLTRDEGLTLCALIIGVSWAVHRRHGATPFRPVETLIGLLIAGAGYALWAAAVNANADMDLRSVWTQGDLLWRMMAHGKDLPAILGVVLDELFQPWAQSVASPFEQRIGVALFWPLFIVFSLGIATVRTTDRLAVGCLCLAAVIAAFYMAGFYMFPYRDLNDLHAWIDVLDRHLLCIVPCAAYVMVSVGAGALHTQR